MTRLALHVVVALCLLTAGCSALDSPTREDRAVAAVENATTAASAVDTYRFDLGLRVVATADDRTETVSVDGDGAVDVGARRLVTTVSDDGEERTTYLLNRTAYRECPEPWGGYGVEEVDADGNWSAQSPLDRQLSLLESGSLYWNGTERLDDERATVVTGEPTAKALTRYRDRRRGSLLGGPSVENARLRVWLDADTGHPLRSELRFDVSGRDAAASARLVTRYSGYGDPVAVELPSEARTDQHELGCPGE